MKPSVLTMVAVLTLTKIMWCFLNKRWRKVHELERFENKDEGIESYWGGFPLGLPGTCTEN